MTPSEDSNPPGAFSPFSSLPLQLDDHQIKGALQLLFYVDTEPCRNSPSGLVQVKHIDLISQRF